LRARCEDVSDALEDTDRIAAWWPSVYRECTIVERGGEHGLGRRVAVTTKGFLPYLIHWQFTVVEQHYPTVRVSSQTAIWKAKAAGRCAKTAITQT
jgi:hypothetical protein